MMHSWDLPSTLMVGGKSYSIRTDYRPCLDIMAAFNDSNLDDAGKYQVMVEILYEENIPENDIPEAIEQALWFLDCGKQSENMPSPRVMDWEQDAPIVFSAINKIAGREVRDPAQYMHWWTFIGYFDEIGEGTFSQVLSIRQKRAKGKKLEKWEQEFLKNNRSMVILKHQMSDEQKERWNMEQKAVDALFFNT